MPLSPRCHGPQVLAPGGAGSGMGAPGPGAGERRSLPSSVVLLLRETSPLAGLQLGAVVRLWGLRGRKGSAGLPFCTAAVETAGTGPHRGCVLLPRDVEHGVMHRGEEALLGDGRAEEVAPLQLGEDRRCAEGEAPIFMAAG